MQLAAPFALIGLVGGWLTGSIQSQSEVTLAFSLVTAVSAGAFGAYLTHHKRRQGKFSGTLLFFGAMLAGTINGALLLLPTVFPLGSLVGGMVGACFSIPFTPALWLTSSWGDDGGKARDGSIVAHAVRRGPMAAAAVSIAAGTLIGFVGRWEASGLLLLRGCAGLATAILAIIVVSDLRAAALVRRALRVKSDGVVTGLDFGVGEDLVMDDPTATLPYRAPTSMVRICGGDPSVAQLRLRATRVRHVLALVVASLLLVAQAFTHAATPSPQVSWTSSHP